MTCKSDLKRKNFIQPNSEHLCVSHSPSSLFLCLKETRLKSLSSDISPGFSFKIMFQKKKKKSTWVIHIHLLLFKLMIHMFLDAHVSYYFPPHFKLYFFQCFPSGSSENVLCFSCFLLLTASAH